MTAPYSRDFSLIDLALADQRDLSAVERFSNFHQQNAAKLPAYRNLIPLTRPRAGEQYAFVVDLDRCSGCKACVSACHSLNGLEEGEMWRSVGTIIGEESPFLQTVTSACHHCVDPGCAAGCPVLAYEKDAETGIVRHLDDQCIGCQYCLLKCPYDVPKYSKTKGIVRKCDMCHTRLAAGEAPACAQACPHDAIRIEIVCTDTARATAELPEARVIAGAFPSSYTVPTTRYTSAKALPDRLRSACTESLRLEHPHWPLIWMLVLTQMAAGLHFVRLSTANDAVDHALSLAAAGSLFCGLFTSVFHLGRPMKAWRVFLGWRRSWMSREIIAFSFYALMTGVDLVRPGVTLNALTACSGAVAVAFSAMIYIDTRRPGWSANIVFPLFFGTAVLLGLTLGAVIAAWTFPRVLSAFVLSALVLRTSLFFWRMSVLTRSAVFRLARFALPLAVSLFFLFLCFAIPGLTHSGALARDCAVGACFASVAGELLDRWIFFVGTPAPRMPGAFTP